MKFWLTLGLLLALICVSSGRKYKHGHKEERSFHVDKKHMSNTHVVEGPVNNGRGKHNKHGRGMGKEISMTEGGIHSLHDEQWLELPKDLPVCKILKCEEKEFCLSNPKTGVEKCINKHSFVEGRKLFKDYHAEKQFLQKDTKENLNERQEANHHQQHKGKNNHSKHGKRNRFSRKHVKLTEHNLKEVPLSKEDKTLDQAEHMKEVHDLMKDYDAFEGHKRAEKGHHKLEIKPADVKSLHDMQEAQPGSANECRQQELYELKTRLVGWFVLQHTDSRQLHHKRDKKYHQMEHHKKTSRTEHGNKHHVVEHIDLHGDVFSTIDKERAQGKLGKDVQKHFYEVKRTDKVKRSADDKPTIETESHHNCKCSKSVMWEFRKQDDDLDGKLSHEELSSLEAAKREPCMKPLLKSCDSDSNGAITQGEWCCCFANTIPPCAEKKRVTDPEVWVPTCDSEGFYKREQCHDKTGYCWCVDLNGNEIMHTKQLGPAHCGKYNAEGHVVKI